MNMQTKRVAMFGLSANPPTYLKGHAGIVTYLTQLGKFDEILIIPVYRHSYAAKSNLELFEHRFNMCKLNFECLSTSSCEVKVLTVEKTVYGNLMEQNFGTASIKMGTIDVVKWMKENLLSINDSISLILGTDTFNDLCNFKWKESEELLKMVDIEVIRRKGISPRSGTTEGSHFTAEWLDNAAYGARTITFHEVSVLNEISSTFIREQVPSITFFSENFHVFGKNSSDLCLEEYLHPQVLQYMKDEKIYMYSSSSVSRRNRSRLLCTIMIAPFVYSVVSEVIEKLSK